MRWVGGSSAASWPVPSPGRCDVCCVTFRTHRGLLRHNALVHKQLPRDAVGRPFIQNNPAIPAGFHDLGFTDFSCRKFPRISQVRHRPRRDPASPPEAGSPQNAALWAQSTPRNPR